MATIKDVAKEAGVSTATVSRVINKSPKTTPSTVSSVKAAMIKLGYRPNANARALANRKNNLIGVLVGDVAAPFFGAMQQGVDKITRERGMQLLIGNGYHDPGIEREAIELLINSGSEMLIIHSKGLSDQELINLSKEVPGMVVINRYIPEIAQRCIASDNYKGAYMATEFLIGKGHQHIAYINADS